MTFLFIAVLVQVAMALLLKVGELYQQDRLVVMGFNYLFAALAASALWAWLGTGAPSPVTLVLGPIGGFFYAIGLFLWMGAIAAAGLGVATVAIRLSVLWPTLLSLTVFGETASALQWLGVLLTFGVLGLLGLHSIRTAHVHPGQRAFAWLLATFVLNGGVGITQKLFTEWAPPREKLALLALVFGSAAVMCGAVVLRRRRRLRSGDMLRGLAFGFGNVTASLCMLIGLALVPGLVAFPFSSIGMILLTSLLGILVWRERPGPLGFSAIALSALAILLMTR